MRNISVFQHSTIDFSILPHIIVITVPDTPLNDAYHVGSLNFRRKYETQKSAGRIFLSTVFGFLNVLISFYPFYHLHHLSPYIKPIPFTLYNFPCRQAEPFPFPIVIYKLHFPAALSADSAVFYLHCSSFNNLILPQNHCL